MALTTDNGIEMVQIKEYQNLVQKWKSKVLRQEPAQRSLSAGPNEGQVWLIGDSPALDILKIGISSLVITGGSIVSFAYLFLICTQ